MEITLTPEDVTNVAPEFSSLEDETIQNYIDLAKAFICPEKWCGKGKQAWALMTAHIMKDMGLSNGGNGSSSATGPITSEKVGDLQRSYGSATVVNGSASDQLLATTKYGKLLVMLRKTITITPMVT